MPLTIQGNWTITVITKSPLALPQRFIVTGANSGNGTYIGSLSSPSIPVTGGSWQLNIQANSSYDMDEPWVNSTMRQKPVQTIGGQYVLIIESEDLVQDNTFDDLVLRLTAPVPVTPNPDPIIPPVVVPVTPIPIIPTPVIPVIPPVVVPVTPVVISPGRVYTKIEIGDKLPNQRIKTTHGIWIDSASVATGNLITFSTCSLENSSSYRRSVYQVPCDQCGSESQFSIAYGHFGGSGSRDLGGYDWLTPTKAVYGQYRSLCLNDQPKFKLGPNDIYHFYAINVDRDRMGDRLDEGNLEINLGQLSGSLFESGGGSRNAHTGSNVKLSGNGKIIRLIVDSTLDLTTLSDNAYQGYYQTVSSSKCHLPESYYMVSGSLEDGVYNATHPHVYGLSYPKLGVVILDAALLDLSASFLTVTGSDVQGDNSMKLFTAMSGAALYTDASGDRLGFQARKMQYSFVEQYFIRVKNQEYNFTNNPSYQSGSEGDIVSDFIGVPQVYISTIGLYNDNHELLAVGKISKPIYKTYAEEALFQVALKY